MPIKQAKRALIALAVNELAQEYDYDAITVDMICKRAQISRSGFYRAFEDKYEILTWCDSFPIERGLGEIGRTLTIAQGVDVAIQGFDLFADMFHSTRKSIKRNQREDDGIETTHKHFCETVRDYHGIMVDKDLDFEAHWAARETLLSIRDRNGMLKKTPDLPKLVAKCYPPKLAKILDDPVDPTGETTLDINTLMLS